MKKFLIAMGIGIGAFATVSTAILVPKAAHADDCYMTAYRVYVEPGCDGATGGNTYFGDAPGAIAWANQFSCRHYQGAQANVPCNMVIVRPGPGPVEP